MQPEPEAPQPQPTTEPEPQPQPVTEPEPQPTTELPHTHGGSASPPFSADSSDGWCTLAEIPNLQLSASGLGGIGAQLLGWHQTTDGALNEDGVMVRADVRALLLRADDNYVDQLIAHETSLTPHQTIFNDTDRAGSTRMRRIVASVESLFGNAPTIETAEHSELPREFVDQVQSGDSVLFQCCISDSYDGGYSEDVYRLFIRGFSATFRPALTAEETAALQREQRERRALLAAADAEASAAAAAAAKVGGRHLVVTGHPVPEFCVRYSLSSAVGESTDGGGDEEIDEEISAATAAAAAAAAAAAPTAFENLHGHILFWHHASRSWVLGFDHKQQELAQEELISVATLSSGKSKFDVQFAHNNMQPPVLYV
jgi:hypothetical protein